MTADLDTDDEAARERGRLLFARPCRFVWAAADLGSLPPHSLPEVAFLGRSNVGKSSLINAVTGQLALARTSNTPGRTRQLNFFSLDDRLLIVDMPGYGYAEASKAEIKRWTEAIDAYLKGRATLRRLCLLVDARHGIKPNDAEMMGRLDKAAVSYQLVLTKIDKLPATARAAAVDAAARTLATRPAAHPVVIATSAETGLGIEALRAGLADLAAAEAMPPVPVS